MLNEKITLKEFQKLDLRVGKILEIENHQNADKLYILTVDLGEERPRQIVAGLKPCYKKEQLLNERAIFVANLEPTIIRGEKSEGMILAADNGKGSIIFLTTESDIEIGSKVK